MGLLGELGTRDVLVDVSADERCRFSTSAEEWWKYWGQVVDGVAAWESAWPEVGNRDIGSVVADQQIITGGSTRPGTAARGKTY